MRPNTLAEVAHLALEGEPFDLCLSEFLDEFYLHPVQTALDEEPTRLRDMLRQTGGVYDAYLAATAEALATHAGLDTPGWA
jgi:hypothetical protein